MKRIPRARTGLHAVALAPAPGVSSRPARLHRLERTLALLLLASLLLTAPAGAQVFFDNLGQVDVFEDTDVVYYIGDHTSSIGTGDWFQGFRFTSSASGELHSIDVAVGNYFGGPDTMEFRLYADAGGALGALLATIPVVASAEDFDGSIRRGRIGPSLSGPPVLAQGTSYWLMATAEGPTIWFTNEQGVVLPRLWTPDGVTGSLRSDTQDAAAFRLNGPPPVPVLPPIGASVLGAALALTGMRSLSARGGRKEACRPA
jgi:hypothetical protein